MCRLNKTETPAKLFKISRISYSLKAKPQNFSWCFAQKRQMRKWVRVTNKPFFHPKQRFCPWAIFPKFFTGTDTFLPQILVLIDLHQTPIISKEKDFSLSTFTLKGLKPTETKRAFNRDFWLSSKGFVPNSIWFKTNLHFQVLIFWIISPFISVYSSHMQMLIVITYLERNLLKSWWKCRKYVLNPLTADHLIQDAKKLSLNFPGTELSKTSCKLFRRDGHFTSASSVATSSMFVQHLFTFVKYLCLLIFKIYMVTV